jgi:hypothetical protein
MQIRRWVGVLGAVFYAVGFVLVSLVPGGGDVDADDFEEFYVTDDQTGVPLLGLFVLTVGAMALLTFFRELRAVIAAPDADLGWAAAALGLAVVVTGASVLTGPSGVQAFSDQGFVGANVAHAFAQAGFAAMLVPGSLFLGFGIAILALSGRRAGVLAPWVAIAGVVAAALQLVAIFWIPSFAVPLWVLLAGAAGMRARHTPTLPE